MAEYIDRENIIPYSIDDDYEEGGERLIVDYKDIKEIPTADVIERYEYEYLKKENRELAIKYDNAMNMVINEQENVTRLRSKINEAITEIKELYTEWENSTDDARLESNPFGAVLNIIQRNIGE